MSDHYTITFICDDGTKFKLDHVQDCCEEVYIESIVGDLEDLVGSEILFAEESINDTETDDGDQRWTFYKLATVKGWVDIRFYGSSNGYYSVAVSLRVEKIVDTDDFVIIDERETRWLAGNSDGDDLWIDKNGHATSNGGSLSVIDGKVIFRAPPN
jgi:hypothetical protein